MATWFVTRHPGALEWAKRQGFSVDHICEHFDTKVLNAGDTVMGTLPLHIAAQVCARGAQFYNLSLDLPAEMRGRELSAEDLISVGARLERYEVQAY